MKIWSRVATIGGVVLILLALLWWIFAPGILIKLPTGIDAEQTGTGEITFFVDMTTGRQLPSGSEQKLPLEVTRTIKSVDDEYDSGTAVVEESMKLSVGGQSLGEQLSTYVLDRKTSLNKEDSRAWYGTPDNKVDRSGAYYPMMPFTNRDKLYPVWKAEVNDSVNVKFVREREVDGLTVYDYVGKMSPSDRIGVPEAYVKNLNLPATTTFNEVAGSLQAMGLDVDTLISTAMSVMTPEDRNNLQTAMGNPIPLNYYWSGEVVATTEPRTGAPIDTPTDVEALSVEPDYEYFAPVLGVLAKYASDPQLGPMLQQLSGMQSSIDSAEPQKIFEYSVSNPGSSIKKAVTDAKDNIGKINAVRLYIPLALLVIGIASLVVGLALMLKLRRENGIA